MTEVRTTSENTILQIPSTLKSLLEALIFAAQEPLSVKQIQAMYEYRGIDGESREIDAQEIARIVDELNAEYAAADKPYRIVQIAGGYHFATLPLYAEWLGKLYKEQARRKLSQSSIESLAIIAYKQPITKPEIESIRGVNCDYVLKTLLEKELVTIVGRATTVGRPLLYGTTREFLKHFGLNEVSDLPRPREIEEILGESQFETERRMLEAQQGLLEKKEEDFKSRLPHIPKRKAGLDDEVKIVPKKRTQEIKVRAREEGSSSQAPAEEVHIASSTEPPVAVQSAPPGEVYSGPEPAQLPPEGVLGSEKDGLVQDEQAGSVEPTEYLEQPFIHSALPLQEPEPTSEPVVDSSAFEVSTPLASEPESSTHDEEAAVESHTGEPQEAIAAAEEFAVPEDTVQAPVQPMVQPPEPAPDRSEEAEEPSLLVHPEVPELATAEVSPDATGGPPENIPPSEVPTSDLKPEILAEVPQVKVGIHSISHSKSRWQTWKEKIQGFIKKLFG